jgi:methionyl-tRNA formyltransferase
MPGQIQEITQEGVLVQCGDREHVLLKQVQRENQGEQAAQEAGLKIHSKLGASPIAGFGAATQRQTS